MGPSPFLDPGVTSTAQSLALIHLKRDLLIPTVLEGDSANTSEYAEGAVTNTRFGSFPHSTLLNLPWGTQVLASKVDTGSRGHRLKEGKKRKRDTDDGATQDGDESGTARAQPTAATSGFAHLLPPTPEQWTMSLPHRTQVVYTPDYSYILQRLRVMPGDCIIEAGAGSGSFTHAAVRAVFNGYPGSEPTREEQDVSARKGRRKFGKVYSFEFHEPRAQQLRQEIKAHGLEGLVQITHRDVYQDGFCVNTQDDEKPGSIQPQANAIFLDLPAPWLALKHLTRSPVSASSIKSLEGASPSNPTTPASTSTTSFQSPLNPRTTVRICTFSPCIEQVHRTVSYLRELGWLEIEMAEVQHRRIDVRRERVGMGDESLRGANPTPSTVEEAIKRLKEMEGTSKTFNDTRRADGVESGLNGESDVVPEQRGEGDGKKKNDDRNLDKKSKNMMLRNNQRKPKNKDLFKEGRLVHRTEQEIKTHTSYLVFAVLPRVWTKEDEDRCRKKWPVNKCDRKTE